MNIHNKYDLNLLCDQLTELAKIASFHKHAKQAEEAIIAELFPDHAKSIPTHGRRYPLQDAMRKVYPPLDSRDILKRAFAKHHKQAFKPKDQ